MAAGCSEETVRDNCWESGCNEADKGKHLKTEGEKEERSSMVKIVVMEKSRGETHKH